MLVCHYECNDSNYSYWNGIWDWAKGKDWDVQGVTSYIGKEIIIVKFGI